MHKEVLVGTLFLAAVALTLFGTVAVSGLDIFTHKDVWIVEIKDLNGLDVGDDVRILGHVMGVVDKITFNRKQYVFRLTLKMEPDSPVHEGYRITVRDTTALGGKHLYVEPGSSDKPRADRAHLVGDAQATDLMTALADATTEIKGIAAKISGGQGTLGKLISDDAIYRNLDDTSASLKTITARIEKGEGTLGRLLSEDDVYAQLRDVVTKLNKGDSALAKLMKDDSGAIIDDLRSASQNIKSITAKIDAGGGAAGKFINDPELYDSASVILRDVRGGKGVIGLLASDDRARQNVGDALQNAKDFTGDVKDITADLKAGRGTFGKLVSDDELYANANAVAKNLSSASGKIDNGTGTIGKLINDTELYARVTKLINRAIDTIENGRDSQPVAAIAGFIFGPFQ